jgi:hypothetical protein
MEKQYAWYKRIPFYLLSLLVTAVMLCIAFSVMVISLNLQVNISISLSCLPKISLTQSLGLHQRERSGCPVPSLPCGLQVCRPGDVFRSEWRWSLPHSSSSCSSHLARDRHHGAEHCLSLHRRVANHSREPSHRSRLQQLAHLKENLL